ncbi:MAG: response regulator [Oscillibacter sp.]|nr:response regulator [Oscillibacter sp.]
MQSPIAYPEEKPASDMILIVDDDAINRKVLGKIFSAYYQVEEAENGRIGIDKLMANPKRCCAILLDVMMPEMSGIEVLRYLKARDMLVKIPVFLITAEQSTDMEREAYQLGVMDIIRKPVVSYVVLRRVQSVIELFEARKHLRIVVADQSRALLEQAERIIQLNQGMIEALATAIEFRDKESGGHVQRISTITRIILENTDFGDGLDEQEIENIALASIMHDVGKINVPDAVLTKPGKLTPEEYEVMKTHTIMGEAILQSIPQMRDNGIYEYACDIARHHHERWDGRGYPDGLSGDEISRWAQVVSLADVYDALSCRRVYKPPIPREVVLEMIQTGQCGMFNPHLLESFLTVEDQLFELYKDMLELEPQAV